MGVQGKDWLQKCLQNTFILMRAWARVMSEEHSSLSELKGMTDKASQGEKTHTLGLCPVFSGRTASLHGAEPTLLQTFSCDQWDNVFCSESESHAPQKDPSRQNLSSTT